jgi:uncharacterized DUF497 family protein
MTTREIEFDPEKAANNLQAHKISFADAALVFVDPLRIERRDDSVEKTMREERWQTLGKVDKAPFVVYTERGEKELLWP